MLVTVLEVSTARSITDGSGGVAAVAAPSQIRPVSNVRSLAFILTTSGCGQGVRVVGMPGRGVTVESNGAITATPCTVVATALRTDWPLLWISK